MDTEGPWLTDAAGQPIEIVALGRYILPARWHAGTKRRAARRRRAPRNSEGGLYASGTQETTTLEVLSGEISAPEVMDGAMTWQWSVPREAQSSPDLVIPAQEKFGLPEQTQRIQLPT